MGYWVVDMTYERYYELIAWLLNGTRKPNADSAFIFSDFKVKRNHQQGSLKKLK